MKLAVIGSRIFTDYDRLAIEVKLLKPIEIVSGGAKGADTLAEQFADSNNLPKKIFLPEFMVNPNIPYHPRWYIKRNMEIVNYVDHVLAFITKNSRGTAHTVRYAEKQGKPVTLKSF